jgi:hypothetical protein
MVVLNVKFVEKLVVIRYRKKHPDRVLANQLNQNEKRRKERLAGIKRYNPEVRSRWYFNKKKDKKWYIKIKKQQNERSKKIKVFLAEYKIQKGCQDCGYKKHHSALDFDHIKGKKELNVCFAKSIGQAKKEIEKCEIVCSNCHRIRTYNRQTRYF